MHRFPIAVNLSPRQFAEERLLDDIKSALADSGLEASDLELEITESILMNEPARAVNILRRLNDLGIRVAIDDFGTGYSSLAYLKQFPIDSVKVDGTFVDTSRTTRTAWRSPRRSSPSRIACASRW